MNVRELETLVASGESESLELKETSNQRRETTQTLCAMLNHRGGRVVIGATAAGELRGQQVSDRTLEELAEEVQRIDPPAFPDVEVIRVSADRSAIVVSVRSGHARPYSYKGTAYKRVGNTTQSLPRDSYNQILFERMHSEQRWENQPAGDWSLDDLDAQEIRRTVDEAVRSGRLEEPGTRLPEDLLRGLNLMHEGTLLRAAAVLFGKTARIEQRMSQCLLRLARFRGVDRSEFVDNRQFRGNAFQLLMEAQRFLLDNMPIAGRILPGQFERIDEPLYPTEALREALANAICHRDYAIGGGSVAVAVYSDRVEVTSTGPLHFGLTAKQLFEPHESMPWNPLIANVFYRRGIIEQWGRGTVKIAELATSAGLPRPQIEDAGGCVTVRFRPSWYTPPQRIEGNLSGRQQRILGLIGGNLEGVAFGAIRAQLPDATGRQVRRDIDVLKALRLIESIGRGRGARWLLAPPDEQQSP